MAVVYRHRRLDTNEIFYIGRGKSKLRAFDKCRRSTFWKNIVSNTLYEVEILCENLSYEDANELEIFLISLYGRRDLGKGSLVNMADGGDGHTNMSPETRLKISLSNKGRNHSEEAKKLIGLASKGNTYGLGYRHTEEAKKKMRESQKNKTLSESHRIKIGKGNSKPIIDLNTGIFYNSVKELASLYNIDYFNLASQLNGKIKNKTPFIYALKQ